MSVADARELRVELERALLRELLATYEELNAAHFKRQLRRPTLELSSGTTRLGLWNRELRAIELSSALVFEQPWGVVVEVLKHEMAHQYVHEVLGETEESAHGPSFQRACERLGIDANAAGLPHASGKTAEEERVLERIAKLLALAESQNANEAQSAANAAQRLMLKYNLESAVGARAASGYGFRHLGKPSGRVTEAERLLAAILAEHFFVEAIWVPVYRPLEEKRGRVLEICGSTANLEMAAYVHAFLGHTAEHLWADHKRARQITSNAERRTFLAGVMAGFRDKLAAQRTVDQKAGLVWVGDADLHRYYRKRHPHIQHTRLEGQRRTAAHAHGREAGRRIVLHKGVSGAAGSAGRLLPPKR